MASMDEGAAGSNRRTWLVLVAVVLLLAAAVLPPLININRYQRRIAESISRSVGRPVHLSEVRLRLLPRPGFEISDFVVDEDPDFGQEPTLRAPSVVASLRLTSLWRGKLEIARIRFDEASLNVVRSPEGRWNFGTVLVKASQTSTAPTGQSYVSNSPRFPYIEAANSRINFKDGIEKNPFSFLNADLSVWLDNPDEWQMRFEAQPVRTDVELDMADTGVVHINGRFKRAASVSQVPLELHAEWTKAPLGQLSRLIVGNDEGWRGDVEANAEITGSGENAVIKTRLRATNVHRTEFEPAETLDVDATCQARFTHATQSLEDIACTSPVGKGKLVVTGAIRQIRPHPQAELSLLMEKLPVTAPLGLMRSIRNGFASDVKARGTIDGGFQYSAEAAPGSRLQGHATVDGLQLTAPQFEEPLLFPTLQLTSATKPLAPRKSHKTSAPPAPQEAAVLLQTFPLASGEDTPLSVDARFAREGYTVHVAGRAAVKSLLEYTKAFNMLAASVAPLAPVGSADMDIRTSGPWVLPVLDLEQAATETTASAGTAISHANMMRDRTEGTVQLKNVRVTGDYLATPLDVPSAHGAFADGEVLWQAIQLNYAQLHAEGSLRYPVPCSLGTGCPATFDLRFATLDGATAEATLLGGTTRGELLEELLSKLDRRPHPWPALSGTIEVGTLTLEQLTVHDAKAAIELKGNEVLIHSFDGHTFGGTLHLSGTMDATGDRPVYTFDAALTKANAADVAAFFHEKWGIGQINATAKLGMSGFKAEDLAASTTGAWTWDWTNGAIVSDGSTPAPGALAKFARWKAAGSVAAETLTIESSQLMHGRNSATYVGTISFDRTLQLKCGPDAMAPCELNFAVGKTKAEPRAESKTDATITQSARK